ncbi:MAG: hypothetical protein ABW209_10175, partial [Pseudomonas caspiana]
SAPAKQADDNGTSIGKPAHHAEAWPSWHFVYDLHLLSGPIGNIFENILISMMTDHEISGAK